MSSDIQANVDPKLSDEACENLWKIYLREAEEYDQGLVKSWKEDMDVTLVFSGLYSAVLTAFVIESYKNLQPDQSELSTNILLHISGQLASPVGTMISAAANSQFRAKPCDIACNIMWFLSLILALSCALLATFVQQWTRHFLHRSTILRAPAARARLLAFLYFGLKHFKMHTIVDLIPCLLHISLFSFFGGLVAFSIPINQALQWMTVGLLVIITLVYATFTMMPLIDLSSPYQTPISPFFWRARQSVQWTFKTVITSIRAVRPFHPWFTQDRNEMLPTSSPSSTLTRRQYNLTYAIVAASKVPDGDRGKRDAMSMAWTLRSLNNDAELLAFIETIPHIIYGIGGKFLIENIPIIRPLLETQDPEGDILARSISLLSHYREFWPNDASDARYRAAISGCLWSLTYALNLCPDAFSLDKTGRTSWFTAEQIAVLERHRHFLSPFYEVPLFSLIQHNILKWSKPEDSQLSLPPLHLPDSEGLTSYINPTDSGEVLLEFLWRATEFLPNVVFLASSSLWALVGDESKCVRSDRIGKLLQLLSSGLKETGEQKTLDIVGWDVYFVGLLQILSQEHVPAACHILLKRIEIPEAVDTLWLPGANRNDGLNHLPIYLHFLQAIISRNDYDDNCVQVLRGIMWSFDTLNLDPTIEYHIEVTWWTHSEVLWLEVLPKIVELDSEKSPRMSSSHLSLSVMIKGMFLKKEPPLRSEFDKDDFISTHVIGPTPITPKPPPTARTAFVALIVSELGAIIEADATTFAEVENTLAYLGCSKLNGAGYDVDPELAKKLAKKTLACTQLWRSHTRSLPLLNILIHIWTLWDVNDLSLTATSNGGTPNPTSLLAEVNAHIRRAIHVFTGLAASRSEVSDNKNGKHIEHSRESSGSSSVAFCFCSSCEDKIKSLLTRIERIEQHWGYMSDYEEDSSEVEDQTDLDTGNEGEEDSEIEDSYEPYVDDSRRTEGDNELEGEAGDEELVGRPSDGNWDRNGWHEDGGMEWK